MATWGSGRERVTQPRRKAPPEAPAGGAKILGAYKCSISALVVPRARAWTRRVDSRSQNLKQTGIKKVGSTFLFLKSAILGFLVSILGQVLGSSFFKCENLLGQPLLLRRPEDLNFAIVILPKMSASEKCNQQ